MTECAFRITPGSDFHNNYFKVYEEKQKFIQRAHDFFQENGFSDSCKFYITDKLHASLMDYELVKFAGQYRVRPDKNGLYAFKERSNLQKEWISKVVDLADMGLIRSIDFWYLPFVSCGSYSLWSYQGAIYGFISNKTADDVRLAEYMEPIKLSEYYSIIEMREENEK